MTTFISQLIGLVLVCKNELLSRYLASLIGRGHQGLQLSAWDIVAKHDRTPKEWLERRGVQAIGELDLGRFGPTGML